MKLRRLFRFRLRTLLIAFTLLAVALGWHAQGARTQGKLSQFIVEHGGRVEYDFQQPWGSEWLYGGGESRVPEWLLESLGVDFFHSVVHVRISSSSAPGVTPPPTDSELREVIENVAAFSQLELLVLYDAYATDEAIELATTIPQVERIWVLDTGHLGERGEELARRTPNIHHSMVASPLHNLSVLKPITQPLLASPKVQPATMVDDPSSKLGPKQ